MPSESLAIVEKERAKNLTSSSVCFRLIRDRLAWKLFYLIIKYNNGVVDDMIKNKMLGQFIDGVGSSAGNLVLTQGLHYLSKVFHFIVT